MMPAMIEQMSKTTSNLPPEAPEALLQVTQEPGDAEVLKMLDASARAYANAFTEEGLLATFEFTESLCRPLVVSKTSQVAAQSGALVKGLMREMLRRLCGKIDCPSAKIKIPTA